MNDCIAAAIAQPPPPPPPPVLSKEAEHRGEPSGCAFRFQAFDGESKRRPREQFQRENRCGANPQRRGRTSNVRAGHFKGRSKRWVRKDRNDRKEDSKVCGKVEQEKTGAAKRLSDKSRASKEWWRKGSKPDMWEFVLDNDDAKKLYEREADTLE